MSILPLELLLLVFDKVNHKDLMTYAKYFEFAKICLKKKMKNEKISLRIASQCGSIYVLEKLFDKNKYYHEIYCLADDAAENGQLTTLKWLTDKDILPTQSVRNLTAYNGHIEVLVWLDKYYPVKYSSQWSIAMYFAIQAKHLNIVKYFTLKLKEVFTTRESRCIVYRRILKEACEYGSLKIIKWVLSKEYPKNLEHNEYNDRPNAMDLAVKNGHIDVIEYLHIKGFKPSFFAVMYAAKNNHLPILIWLYKNTDILNKHKTKEVDYSLAEACKAGNKNIVSWMIDTFEYTQDILDLSLHNAMNNCHFEIAKFLKEKTKATNTRWFPINN